MTLSSEAEELGAITEVSQTKGQGTTSKKLAFLLSLSCVVFVGCAIGPTSIPTVGTPVQGDVWQVTVTSVSRTKGLGCRYYVYRSKEGYELLQVTVRFVPIEKEEGMSVSSKDVAVIDSEDGKMITAQGGGVPPNCSLGTNPGEVGVVISYLRLSHADSVTEVYYFVVAEGKKGYRFQFRDYRPIVLNE